MKLTKPGIEKQKRRDLEIKRLYNEGVGYAAIGEQFKISRQRVYQIIQGNSVVDNA